MGGKRELQVAIDAKYFASSGEKRMIGGEDLGCPPVATFQVPTTRFLLFLLNFIPNNDFRLTDGDF